MRVEKGIPKHHYDERRDFEHSDPGTIALGVGKDATTAQRGSGGLPEDEATSDEDDDEDDVMTWQ
jgi:hypothetical protein